MAGVSYMIYKLIASLKYHAEMVDRGIQHRCILIYTWGGGPNIPGIVKKII